MLKKITAVAALLIGFQAGATNLTQPILANVSNFQAKVMSEIGAEGLNWKVGDTADYKISMEYAP